MRTHPHRLAVVLVVSAVGCGGDDPSVSFTTLEPQSTGTEGTSSSGPGSESTAAASTTLASSGESSSSSADESESTVGTDSGSSESTTGVDVDPCDEVDPPDINGFDENGDGIDGLLDCSVYVNATVGSDLNDGLVPDEPVATIGRGIDLASTFSPPRQVLVAAATYAESVSLDSGVSLFGGYDPDDWQRDVLSRETVIAGPEARTLVAINLEAAVEVDGFTIRGRSYTDGGQSTYAVWVRDTPDGVLQFDYCTIEAGDAGVGNDGANASDGEDGGNGSTAVGGTGGAGGTSGCGATGGAGGTGTTCPSTGGTDGAAGGDPTTVGTGGAAGLSHCGGCNDDAGDAAPGLPGSVGTNGDAGLASNDPDGSFGGDGFWVPPLGSDAARGHHGSGGGGGGAGGFDLDPGICLFVSGNGIGGGGGGGGAGGCGGLAGGRGEPGGGSFGITVIASSIRVTNTNIRQGAGGAGGRGGDGGNGGIPGQPGNGVAGIDDGGEPGDGRNGGPGSGGGGGGGGAGGCGGSSIGIVTVDGAAVAIANVSFSGGSAGTPGFGGAGGIRADGLGLSAPNGETGCAGVTADERAY